MKSVQTCRAILSPIDPWNEKRITSAIHDLLTRVFFDCSLQVFILYFVTYLRLIFMRTAHSLDQSSGR